MMGTRLREQQAEKLHQSLVPTLGATTALETDRIPIKALTVMKKRQVEQKLPTSFEIMSGLSNNLCQC